MINPTPTYELVTDEDLSKFLLGAIRDVRKKELAVEEADAISKLADKYIKHKIAVAIEKRLSRKNERLDFNGEVNKLLLQKTEQSTQEQ